MRITLKCKECNEVNEIYCDGDNPLFCPDCRSIDSFTEVENEENEEES